LNADLLRKAADSVGNPNILVNLISKRVRQLNAAGGSSSHPLVSESITKGIADIALAELVEGKMGWETIEVVTPETGPARRRRRS
jgi:DNA-directed RNA polymerase subunit omega